MNNSCSMIPFRNSMYFVPFLFLLALFITLSATPLYAGTLTVTTTSDDVSNPDSLRYAIENATSQDVIIFDLDYPAIITLNEQLSIDHGLTIQGPGADLLAVSGNEVCRVFYIEDIAESVDISGISIVSGDAGEGNGGGIYSLPDSLTVENCHFSGNHAYYGGGMYNLNSSPTMMNCTFLSNTATDDGGGMYNHESSPTVTNCTFSLNTANNGGGMCNTYSNSPIVTNCTFASNSAFEDGGGMYNWTCTLKVTNCTFISNTANDGGGIYCDSSYSTVMNCTFTLNSANLGGGMWIGKAIPTIINSIFWGNTGGEIYNRFAHFSYCVISDDNPGDYGANNINTDPILQPLADNGGPTMTCALGEGSSAIDAGTSVEAPDKDQRGAPRPFNVSFDIGAYESGIQVYEIIATCSDGGSISPTEAHTLSGLEDEVFYLMPNEGYVVEAVYVDDLAIESSEIINNTFTFEDVTANHSIHVDFKPDYDGDGCNISALPGIALLLVAPLIVLSRKIK